MGSSRPLSVHLEAKVIPFSSGGWAPRRPDPSKTTARGESPDASRICDSVGDVAGVADRVLVQTWDKVERILGDEAHCKKVDKAVRQAIEKELERRGLKRVAAPVGNRVGAGASRVCAGLGARNRTLLVLAGAGGLAIFGLLEPDEVWPGLREALKNSRLPLSVPLHAAGLPGKLNLVVQADQATAEFKHAGGDLEQFNAFLRFNWAEGRFMAGGDFKYKSGPPMDRIEFEAMWSAWNEGGNAKLQARRTFEVAGVQGEAKLLVTHELGGSTLARGELELAGAGHFRGFAQYATDQGVTAGATYGLQRGNEELNAVFEYDKGSPSFWAEYERTLAQGKAKASVGYGPDGFAVMVRFEINPSSIGGFLNRTR